MKCRKCGKPILMIQERIYRTIPVDDEIVYLLPGEGGRAYIRPDGSKVKGYEVTGAHEGFTEHVFRPHAYNCIGRQEK